MSIRIHENQPNSGLFGILARTLLLEVITGHKKPGQQPPTSSFLRGPPGPLFFDRALDLSHQKNRRPKGDGKILKEPVYSELSFGGGASNSFFNSIAFLLCST